MNVVTSAMTKWIILLAIVSLAIVSLAWVAWRGLPVGGIYGRMDTLSDLIDLNVMLQLQISSARAALAECMKLPARERLPKLLEAEKLFGDVSFAGDEIRQAIVATGVSEAASHFRRMLDGLHDEGSANQEISGALAGTAENITG